MTRFARKVSSRGTTQREPEEATPWSQMVAQVNQKKFDVEDEDDFMEGVEEADDGQMDKNPAKDDVEDESDSENEAVNGHVKQVQEDQSSEDSEDGENEDDDYGARLDVEAEADDKQPMPPTLISSDGPTKKKKRKKAAQKCKVCGSKEHIKMNCDSLSEERRKELQDLYNMKVGRAGLGKGRKKKKKNKDKLPYEDDKPVADNSEDPTVDKSLQSDKENSSKDNLTTETKKSKNKNKNKNKDKSNNRTKPPIRDRTGAIVEKGEAVFHGFRVSKPDEKRLQGLYKELKQQGLTKSELDAAIKKERRIAEKNLARSKKLVCFKCRMPGHMLADCPQAEDLDKRPSSGLCFKCGSLEHTSKDCKLKRSGENAYNFASCFICKQEGHLAKACPDNPKGLYPKGGGCIFCGSVEHLKRDCPRKVEKDLKSGVKVAMMSDNVEDEPSFDRHLHSSGGGSAAKKRRKDRPEKIVSF